MELGRERCFFAGGNTPSGFVNFFGDIYAQDEKDIYIIKGGPGTGKSRLMKSVSKAAILSGYDVEIIRCSSDPDSLDGVRIPALRRTILDGTAPHTMDSVLPGARDNIINLGDHWDRDKLKIHKNEIETLAEQKADSYKRVYNYLKAARAIQDNLDYVADKALSKGKLNIFINSICENFFGDIDISCKDGEIRKMFATAIAPKGMVCTLDTLFRGLQTYVLKCDYGRSACYVVEKLEEEAVKRGFLVESIKCPFDHNRTEHLIIPQLSLAFTTHNKYHSETDCDVFGKYLLDVYYNDNVTEPYSKDMEYDFFRVQELIDKASRYLEKAQTAHKKIESYYIDNMDFEAVNRLTDRVIEDMLR